jgi:hypothetical protein
MNFNQNQTHFQTLFNQLIAKQLKKVDVSDKIIKFILRCFFDQKIYQKFT